MLSDIDLQRISIIIPALNEADMIERAISITIPSFNTEVIVVDGGSTDHTIQLAQGVGATVISSFAGRANQMNVGAQAATGEILIFLHADTLLPPGFDRLIRVALKDDPIAGAFALKIDGAASSLRWVEWGVNWRSRFLQLPYGDQAIFLSAAVFQKIDGFPELSIMEDFELMRRLKRFGKIVIISTSVVTSARRWLQRGVFLTTVINQLVVLGYLIGVNHNHLRRLYRQQKD
jgi:rSAM/selenodomain-associated transferase 2